MSLPATLTDVFVTMPPMEITATSVVPPPTSTTMDPSASLTGTSAPIAAAKGSSMVYAFLAPADSVASLTALSSTPVTPEGTQTATRGLTRYRSIDLFGRAPRMKYASIFSVTSKSAITPFFRGWVATMWAGVRPIMLLAAEPTATTLSVFVSTASAEGSERTTPQPLTNTNVFAVPKSMATSGANSRLNIPIFAPWSPPCTCVGAWLTLERLYTTSRRKRAGWEEW